MLKMSFKIQITMVAITVIAVVFVIVYFVNKTNEHTHFAQIRAQKSADMGFQIVTEKAVSVLPETGEHSIIIDSIQNVSGETEDGDEYSVSVKKDTISLDSIIVKIKSTGTFAGETRTQSRKLLLISSDSTNWFFSD